MKHGWTSKMRIAFVSASLLTSSLALAHEVEGRVERVDAETNSFVIKGQTIYVDARTEYDDGLDRFEDIKVGDRLEVDFHEKDGRKVAHEIDREGS